MIRLFSYLFMTLLVAWSSGAKRVETYPKDSIKSGYEKERNWVDSVYGSMNLQERIGQLLMVRAYSKGEAGHERQIRDYIEKYHIGGLCFFQGAPRRQVQLINDYQTRSKVPLLIALDAEWGLGMRFKQRSISFPRQLMLGALEENKMIYEMGLEVARELKRIGVQVNFAPVVDINNNPDNPVINDRSFGEDRVNVTAKGYSYMKGLQDGGVMACLKHFPGHGDTDVDSHKDLPVIPHGMRRLDSLELFPFKVLMEKGAESAMVAHLNVPALGIKPGFSTTLSKETVTDLLQKKIGFRGLIFTDALDMQGVAKYHPEGEIEVLAFEAGNDVLVLPQDVPQAIRALTKAITDGRIPEWRLETSVKKILHAKYKHGLDHFIPLKEEQVYDDIITADAMALKSRLIADAITLVRDEDHLLDRLNTAKSKATLSIGTPEKTVFQKRLNAFGSFDHFTCSQPCPPPTRKRLLKELKDRDIVVISVHQMNKYKKKDFNISYGARDLIDSLAHHTRVILTVFGSPYSLAFFDRIGTVVMAYSEDEIAQDMAAQALFGAVAFKGHLPVTASQRSRFGTGIQRAGSQRMGYVLPEFTGLCSDTLEKIDSILAYMIEKKIAPGAQVLIAKEGKIVFHRAYGYHTYKKKRPVSLGDIYDLASVTKVAATTISLMKLWDERKFDLDVPISRYFPEADTTDKGNLTFRAILAHHARLKPWIPFYRSTIICTPKGTILPKSKYYSYAPSPEFPNQVCQKMYITDWYPDSIWKRILQSPLREKYGYKYSDLGLYMAARAVKVLSGERLDKYVRRRFYDPMGLRNIGYNPLRRGISPYRIPPTEEDHYFRMNRIQGFVHDMGAAMMDGVSGHAGLFSNAADLAAVFQMLLNGGTYGGKRYLSQTVIDSFTHRYKYASRRGIGFDMKELDPDNHLNVAKEVSSEAFGHYGFTGTTVWADPKYNLVYVFLSNRTYPDMKNRAMYKEEIREKVQSIIYRALKKH